MTTPTTSCTTTIDQLAAAERQAAYDVAHQNVVICENRCEITAIKKHLARLTSIVEPEARRSSLAAQREHTELEQATQLLDSELQRTGKNFSSRLVTLAAETSNAASAKAKDLQNHIKGKEQKVCQETLNPAYANFRAKESALKGCFASGCNYVKQAEQHISKSDREACAAWNDTAVKALTSARDKHWRIGTPYPNAYLKFPPSMRLYPGVGNGISSGTDTESQRKLAEANDEAEARIESIVLALEDLRTQYNNKKLVAEDAVKVAEQSSAERGGILNKEKQTLAQLKNEENKIADKVEKARKHVDVVTQEEVVSVANTDYVKAMGEVNKSKQQVKYVELALGCITSSQGLWIPYKEALNSVQAAEEQLWLAGEELRMANLASANAKNLHALAGNNSQSCGIYQRDRPDITVNLLQQINEKPRQTKGDITKSLLGFVQGAKSVEQKQIIALFYALYNEDASLVSTRDLLKTKLEELEQAKSNPKLLDAKERLDKAGQRLQSVRAEVQEYKQKWEDAVKILDINIEKMQEKEEIWELTQARLELAKMQIPATNTNGADGQASQNQSDVMWTALIKLPEPTGIAKPPSVQPINPSHQHGIGRHRNSRYMKHR